MATSELLSVVAQFGRETNIPADAVENVFHFRGDGVTDDVDAAYSLHGMVYRFWRTTTGAQTWPVSSYLATCINRTAGTGRLMTYARDDLSGTTPTGPPILSEPFEPSAPAGTGDFPAEVAVCLSYHGDLTGLPEDVEAGPAGPVGNVHPAARSRGRIFVGPLMGGVASVIDANNEVMVSEDIQTDLGIAAGQLVLESSVGENGMPWVVWSRKAEVLRNIVGGFVNNAFDTQRRRGNEDTARSLWVPAV